MQKEKNRYELGYSGSSEYTIVPPAVMRPWLSHSTASLHGSSAWARSVQVSKDQGYPAPSS